MTRRPIFSGSSRSTNSTLRSSASATRRRRRRRRPTTTMSSRRRRTLVKRQTMPRGFDPQGLCCAAGLRPCRGWRERAGVAALQAGREARRVGAAVHHRLRRLRLCGRGEFRDQPLLAGRPRLRVRDRPCARRHGQRLALVRGRQARQEAEHVSAISSPPSASSSPKALPARAKSWRRAAAPAAC